MNYKVNKKLYKERGGKYERVFVNGSNIAYSKNGYECYVVEDNYAEVIKFKLRFFAILKLKINLLVKKS